MWQADEVRSVKLTFMRQTRKHDDLSIIFGVDGSQRKDFFSTLQDFLNFVQTHNGEVMKVDTVTDAETHEVCSLHLHVYGDQQINAEEFRRRLPTFASVSKYQN